MMHLSWVLATLGGGRPCPAFCPGLAGSVALTSSPLSPSPKSPIHVHDHPLSRHRRPSHLSNDREHRCSLDGVSSSRVKRGGILRGRSCRAPLAAAGRAGINNVEEDGHGPTPPDQPPDAVATDNAKQAVQLPPNVIIAHRRDSKQGSVGGVGVQTPLAPTVAVSDVDAQRMYAVARSLHLRRHRSCASRGAALHLFRETMRLRPGWIETDSRFAMDSGIDDVFRAFAFGHGCPDSVGSDSSSSFEGGTEATRARDSADAVACLRATLAGMGYTARRVQEKFYAAVGPVRGHRLPGPYYLRKSFDHNHAATVASLGPPREALDVAIRLFLLGLALPEADVERSLGKKAIESAHFLGILGECPVDSSVAVSLVQLFPLDAEALSPSAYLPGRRTSCGEGSFGEPRRKQDRVVEEAAAAGGEGMSTPTRSVGGGESVASPSDLIFATDWPPPGSTALTEEPVMYIGPDSIGLVQHAPRSPPHPTARDRAEVVTERRGGQDARSASPREEYSDEDTETILDLCCGSGVQGIAAAALRGGNAHVTCVDINPRAVRFARFNALLNGLDEARFSAITGDLYSALSTAPPGNTGSSHAAHTDVGAPTPSEEGCTASGWVEEHGTAEAESPGDLADSVDGRRAEGDEGPGGSGSAGSTASSDDSRQARPGDDLDFGSGWSPLYREDDALLVFDLILANPPFVPVPPKLGSAKRRYDVFAAGGANGEDIVEGIFRGAAAHLRPGGLLAVVSELVNPRTFDAKLRRWVGAVGVGSRSAAVDVQVNGGTIAENLRHLGGTDRAAPSGVACASDGGAGGAWEACAWNGVVLHEKEPWTAREYAARRSGSAREAEGWERHLQLMGIEEMAPGFVFIRRRRASSVEAQRVGNSSEAASQGAVEMQGVEKVWAPYNAAAVENTEIALGRIQQE